MESGPAMSSDAATAPSRSCEVCGAAATAEQTACAVCGAHLGAPVPTGSRPPVEPTNFMTLPEQSSSPESDPAQPAFTRAGLPSRRPRVIKDDADALDAFTRSWEADSDDRLAADPSLLKPFAFTPPKPAPAPSRPPTIDDFIRGSALGRDSSAAGLSRDSSAAAEPPSPPDPAEPPAPPSPPEPPGPMPAPTPVPPGPYPDPLPPRPTPDPIPPVPTPDPVPTPGPNPPLPSPNPSPPGPVPPPPSMAPSLPPGVYRGGKPPEPATVVAQAPQSRISAESPQARVPAARRATGTVYGGQSGAPTSANADAPLERSGSLTGQILARGRSSQSRVRPARRARLRTAMFFSLGLVIFMSAIAVIVYVLAGDFIRSFFDAVTQL
jgi:hypothetical protein